MTAPAGTPTQPTLEDQVKQAELQLRLATAEASIRDLKADKQLPKIPDLTDRTPTLSDNGGAAAASLAAIKVVSSRACRVVVAVLNATTKDDTIVLLSDASIAPRLGAAYEVRARIRSLALAINAFDQAEWDVAIPIPDLPKPGGPAAKRRGVAAEPAGAAEPGAVAAPTLTPVGPPAAQALTFAIDLLDALSPRVTLSGRELPTTSTALRAKLAGALASGNDDQCRSVITPDQATVLTSCSFQEAKDLALRVDAMRANLLLAQARIAPITTRLEALRAERDLDYHRFLDAAADRDKGDKEAVGAEVARIDGAIRTLQQVPEYVRLSTLVARATTTIGAVDTYLASITSRVDGVSPLQAAALAELLTGHLDLDDDLTLTTPANWYLLYAEVVMAAGDVLTTTSLFETSIDASGAAQIIYRLTDVSGRVLASGEEHDVRHEELIDDELHSFRKWATLGISFALIIAVTIAVVVLLRGLFS